MVAVVLIAYAAFTILIGVFVSFWAGVALVLGIPIYRMQRRHMTQPDPVPQYR